MSFEPDNVDHEQELEVANYEIVKLLKAIVLLLEVIADVDVNETTKMMDGD